MENKLLNFYKKIKKFNGIKVLQDESMENHTSIRIGGKATLVVLPLTVNQFVKCLNLCINSGIKYHILGNGTNTLVDDKGYDGVIIKTTLLNSYNQINSNKIFVNCGMGMFTLNNLCAKLGLSGLEWSYGIPGSFGGAITMNAGCFGHEIAELITKVVVYDGNKIVTINKNKMNFGYRKSIIQEKNYFVIGAELKLEKAEVDKILENQKTYFNQKKLTQPYDKLSAGSVFKKVDNIAVSKLIDELGFKGKRVGDAVVSEKHAGFIINEGKATCQNVLDLVQLIKEKIKLKHNLDIEMEIKYLK